MAETFPTPSGIAPRVYDLTNPIGSHTMTNSDKVWQMLDRVTILADKPLGDLRRSLAGFGTSYAPTRREIGGHTQGMTRGELVKAIIAHEYDDETSSNGIWGGVKID